MTIYRNPRFMVDHIYRFLGLTAFSSPQEDTAFPFSRLIDDQQLRFQRLNTAGVAEIIVDRGTTEPSRRIITRVIGENSNAHEGFVKVSFQHALTLPAWTTFGLLRSDGTEADELGAPDFFDFELNTDVQIGSALQFNRILYGDSLGGSAVHQLGELFTSRMLTTTSGIVQSWTELVLPNSSESQTLAGNTYLLERGDARRVWNLEYRRLKAIDAFTLDSVNQLVGRIHPFYFDSPTSGEAYDFECIDFVFDPSGNWTSTDIDISFESSQPDAGRSDFVRLTANAATISAGVGFAEYTFPPGTSSSGRPCTDFRGRNTSVDYRGGAGGDPLADNDHTIGFFNSAFQFTEYSLSNGILADSANSGEWLRSYQNILEDTPVAQSSAAPVDLTSIATVRFIMRPQAIGEQFDITNYQFIDLVNRPAFVELIGYERQQDSANPAGSLGPLYTVRMALREVLS